MDSYKFIHFLGKGGFGYVSLVKNSEGKEFALKEIDLSELNEKDKNYIMNEIDLGKKFEHENICKVKDSEIKRNNVKIIMEYCNGGDLHNYKEKLKRNERALQYIFKQLLEGTKYLHETMNIIHRDIKPRNILLNFPEENKNKDINELNYVVKLADFGLSKILKNGIAYSRCGTKNYMSSRKLKNKSYGFEDDIYALGITYFELLTGKRPYEVGDNYHAKEIDKRKFKIKGIYSKETVNFGSSMLQKKRKNICSLENLLKHPFINEDLNNFERVLLNPKLSLNKIEYPIEQDNLKISEIEFNQENRKVNDLMNNQINETDTTKFKTDEDIKKINDDNNNENND